MVASETFERIVRFAEADVESRLIGLLRSIPWTEIGNATKCPEKEQVLSLCNAIAGAVGQSGFLLQDFAQEFPGHLAALVGPQDLVAVRKALEVWQLARAETEDPKQPHDAKVAKKSTKKLGKKGDTNSECGLLHFFIHHNVGVAMVAHAFGLLDKGAEQAGKEEAVQAVQAQAQHLANLLEADPPKSPEVQKLLAQLVQPWKTMCDKFDDKNEARKQKKGKAEREAEARQILARGNVEKQLFSQLEKVVSRELRFALCSCMDGMLEAHSQQGWIGKPQGPSEERWLLSIPEFKAVAHEEKLTKHEFWQVAGEKLPKDLRELLEVFEALSVEFSSACEFLLA